MIPDDQRDRLRVLLCAKSNRADRLQAMIALLGADGVVALVLDTAEKHGIERAIDRHRLPLLATMALLRGEEFTGAKRKICGARCRTGLPCQAKARPKSGRCRMHGNGGPRTPEGKARAMENLKLRWKR